jgi:hypothetical protein
MKPLFKKISIAAIVILFIGCAKKSEHLTNFIPQHQSHIRCDTSGIELLTYQSDVRIYNTDSSDYIDAIVSANNEAILDSYLNCTTLYFDPIGEYETPESESESSPDSAETFVYSDFHVRISLLDSGRTGSNGYTLNSLNKSSGYNYEEDFDSQNDNVKVMWVYTSNSNNDLFVTIRYKNCGLCSKYTLVNTFLSSGWPSSSYYKKSKRLYATVSSNWKNRSVTFY